MPIGSSILPGVITLVLTRAFYLSNAETFAVTMEKQQLMKIIGEYNSLA